MVAGGGWRFKKGTWGAEEDALLQAFVKEHGEGSWNTAHQYFPDLNRSGKSCRLRYLNQLHPGICRGSITPCEERFILVAHSMFGNQWSRIAALLPGRTDNFVKNVVNMWLKRARRRRTATNSAVRAAQMRLKREQAAYAPGHDAMNVSSSQAQNHISLPTSACGLSVLPQPPAAKQAGMHGTLGCSDSSLRSYIALVASGGMGAVMMNDLAAEVGACMQANPTPAGAGVMNTVTIPAFSPMLVTESKIVEPYNQGSNFGAVPTSTSSYNIEWPAPMQPPLAVHAPQERLSGCTGMLPSVQNSFKNTLQLPSVQTLFYESSKLPSVQNVSSVSPQLPLVQDPLQSLEGSELPSVQSDQPFQSLLLGSEQLPSFQRAEPRQPVVDIPDRPILGNPIVSGDNDLMEAIKLNGLYCSSSSMNCGDSSSSATSACLSAAASAAFGLPGDLPFATSHLKHAEEGDILFCNMSDTLQHLLATEEMAGEFNIGSLMLEGLNGDLASMVLDSNDIMWSSMPGASSVGEFAGGKTFYP